MFLESSGINFKLYRMLYGPPGGNQVDGLPPAASDREVVGSCHHGSYYQKVITVEHPMVFLKVMTER